MIPKYLYKLMSEQITIDVNGQGKSKASSLNNNNRVPSGFPHALEVIENLENHEKRSMQGKIMEFEKTSIILENHGIL